MRLWSLRSRELAAGADAVAIKALPLTDGKPHILLPSIFFSVLYLID